MPKDEAVVRLATNDELDILLPESEQANINSFKRLLPDFYYNETTNRRIIDNLDPSTRSVDENYLDDLLKLNEQRRAWFTVDFDKSEDKAYNTYTNFLRHTITELRNKEEMPSYLGEEYHLLTEKAFDRENFRKNEVRYKKQNMKLFKLLIKNKWLTTEQLDEINTIKTKGDQAYLCVSRNVIDYMFISTNQPFRSCESFDSQGEGSYYMGLPAQILDTNRVLIFLSPGRVRNHSIKNFEFKHFKYFSRSWYIYVKTYSRASGKEDTGLSLVNYYPSMKLNFNKALSKYINFVDIYKKNDDIDYKSPFTFNLGHYKQNEDLATIYIDNISLSLNDRSTGEAVYDRSGYGGSITHFEFSGKFNEIRCFDDLYEDGMYCNECNERVHHDDTYYDIDGYPYCEHCYNEIFVMCYKCFAETVRDDAYVVEGRYNDYYCENCYYKYIDECSVCQENFLQKDMLPGPYDDLLCQNCHDKETTTCDECGRKEYKEDVFSILDKNVCNDCHSKLTESENE